MPKINREEYEHLKGLYSKREWIARDEDGGLWAYNPRPYKLQGEWQGCPSTELNSDLFQFIKWEDEEPHNIAELIEEYEDYQYTADWHAEQLAKLSEVFRDKESEETEVKNIEWLKEKIKGEYEYNRAKHNKEGFGKYACRKLVFRQVLDLFNQLDEPEKVVVPQFVSDFIDEYKNQGYSLSNAIFNISRGDEDLDIEEYFRENPRTCIDAWDNGYEVEKEQKYYVKEPTTGQFLIKDNQQSNGVKWVDGFSSNPESYTEKEIKAIDKRFWAFVEEVSE